MLSKSITTGKYFWSGSEISETEYNRILEIIRNKPASAEGVGYRLTESLEWEQYELPPVDDDVELTEAEALGILLGGAI